MALPTATSNATVFRAVLSSRSVAVTTWEKSPRAKTGANGLCFGSRTKSRLFIRRPATPTDGIARSTGHTLKYTAVRRRATTTRLRSAMVHRRRQIDSVPAGQPAAHCAPTMTIDPGAASTVKRVATTKRTSKQTRIHPIDIHVGQRLRERRLQAALGLEALGARVGVSAQQIQKYEFGQDRISASRLYLLAGALQVPLKDFFHGLPKRFRTRGAGACPTLPC
jgi:hypothetical protein